MVKYLKAGSGDSILIQDGTYNILIDGGNEFTHIRDEVTKIFNLGQKLDLVVVTQHDDDHISGIIKLIEAAIAGDFGDGFIEKILVNTPRKINGTISSDEPSTLSYKQAFDLENLLLTYKTAWSIVTGETPIITFGEINLRFLSPLSADLGKYSSAKGAYLTSDYRCDWDSTMAALDPFISDKSQDSSDANKTSVVILLESQGEKILLTGDCVPKRLEAILDKLISEDPGKPLKLDYVKLPHHGSYRSLSKSILSKIDCSKFIISANGNKDYLPNKRAILKVLKYISPQGQDIEFLFNYSEPIHKLKITAAEKQKYKFKLTPNNQIYGHSI
jgi:glyoxylase-like metal-dependent hydrolase (beta-lactamase superfamily II)